MLLWTLESQSLLNTQFLLKSFVLGSCVVNGCTGNCRQGRKFVSSSSLPLMQPLYNCTVVYKVRPTLCLLTRSTEMMWNTAPLFWHLIFAWKRPANSKAIPTSLPFQTALGLGHLPLAGVVLPARCRKSKKNYLLHFFLSVPHQIQRDLCRNEQRNKRMEDRPRGSAVLSWPNWCHPHLAENLQ